jgi:hypothetical protein
MRLLWSSPTLQMVEAPGTCVPSLHNVFLMRTGLLQAYDFASVLGEAVGLGGFDRLGPSGAFAWCRHTMDCGYQSISALSVPVLSAGAVASLTSKP